MWILTLVTIDMMIQPRFICLLTFGFRLLLLAFEVSNSFFFFRALFFDWLFSSLPISQLFLLMLLSRQIAMVHFFLSNMSLNLWTLVFVIRRTNRRLCKRNLEFLRFCCILCTAVHTREAFFSIKSIICISIETIG